MKKRFPKNQSPKNPFRFLLIIALTGAVFSLYFSNGENNFDFFATEETEQIAISQFLEKYKNDELETINIEENELIGTDNDKKIYKTFKEPSVNLVDLGLNDKSKSTVIEIIDTSGSKFWNNLLIGLAPFILLVLIFVFLSRKMGSGENSPFGFGKSKAKTFNKKNGKTKFTDVAGAEEAKEEVAELVDFLKSPKKYLQMGAKIPKGVLLIGPPGTGKTLLARAIAGEAKVPFSSVSGSEFVEMFVGVGASRVRDLFKLAKKNSPSIIFIDEIDAIGKKRGQGTGGGHDEREQTLNQILTEMDGFEKGTSVIVIAATNRPDVLDKALLRPGRFDRRVQIDLPEMKAREQILKVHTKNKKASTKLNLKEIATKTVGFSGADLENVMNEAAIMAVKNNQKTISQENLHQAVEKVAIGPERKSRKFTETERKMTAYHEVGHALAGHFCENHDPVNKISIVSRGRTLGVTWFLPEEDVYSKTRQKLFDEMVSLHGGRMAEQLIFGEKNLTTGASNDLERIANISRAMIMRFGMAGKDLGAVSFYHEEMTQKPYSEETGRLIDKEVQKLIEAAEKKCLTILKKHQKLLEKISLDLLKKENISREEFEKYFKK